MGQIADYCVDPKTSRAVARGNNAASPTPIGTSPEKGRAHQDIQHNHNPNKQGQAAATQGVTEKNGTPHEGRPKRQRKQRQVHAYPGATGFEEREQLRRRARGLEQSPRAANGELRIWHPGMSTRSAANGSRLPAAVRDKEKMYSVIPHAASGRAAHTGRGGFPAPHRLFIALIHALLPKTTHRVYGLIAQDPQSRGLRWAHPIQSVEDAINKPIQAHRDAEEAKQAERVRWLPPGVRGVVVGRNSQIFDEELDLEDLELFAAIEYKALNVLTWLVIVVSARE